MSIANLILPISQVRAQLPSLVNDVAIQRTLVSVKGKVKAALIDAEELERLEATLEILSDPQAMAAIKQGEKEIAKGEVVDWELIKEDLDL